MTIGIYGLGRFGSFWASTLRSAFPSDTVLGYSRRSSPPNGVQAAGLEKICQADTLFLCTAISSMETVLQEIEPHLEPSTLVADTCSVKHYPFSLMEKTLGDRQTLLATHPMFGPDSGKEGVAGLPLVVHPFGKTSPLQEEWIRRFERMGIKVLRMTPEQHDEAAALTQGVAHLVGRILGDMKLESHPMATKGFLNLQEIVQQTCNDPWQLFLDLQRYNPFTTSMRERFVQSVAKVLEAIKETSDD